MAEPEDILTFLQKEAVKNEWYTNQPLKGKKALVTAGPTFEAIDPVRFIGNHSSGKMGYALAKSLQKLGAEVTLISGPSSLETPEHINYIPVVSAEDMLKACLQEFPNSNITVMSAAVADYRPKRVSKEKIKKSESNLELDLKKTTDILFTLGSRKAKGQLLIGFALETANEIENAKEKLAKKNLDFIVLNSLQDKDAGFAGDQNKITILTQKDEQISFELKSKTEAAMDICREIIKLIP